jgi:hypothetical protein
VFGHDDIAEYVESVTIPGLLNDSLKIGLRFRGSQIRIAAGATEGDEVGVACFLSSLESWWHWLSR